MKKTEYQQIAWAEMKPDCYDGPDCDQLRPQWDCYFYGDMDSEETKTLDLDAKIFQPGTKIIILEPECPKCEQQQSICRDYDSCDFDWDEWTLGKYS